MPRPLPTACAGRSVHMTYNSFEVDGQTVELVHGPEYAACPGHRMLALITRNDTGEWQLYTILSVIPQPTALFCAFAGQFRNHAIYALKTYDENASAFDVLSKCDVFVPICGYGGELYDEPQNKEGEEHVIFPSDAMKLPLYRLRDGLAESLRTAVW